VTHLRRLAWVAFAASTAAGGCYSPNISQGGFSCGDGNACPDKFHCAADNRCYQGAVDAHVEMPLVCESVTNTTPVCTTGPVGGQCNPSCQLGCDCGWCAVVGGASKCLTGTEGSKDVGEVCDPKSSTSCKAGLYCQPECGDATGRCYKFCSMDSDCGSDVSGSSLKCNVNLRQIAGAASKAQFLLCALASPMCDVVGKTGCPPLYSCYPFGAQQTECDCTGSANTGDLCPPTCVPGDSCVQLGMNAPSMCLQACNNSADCTMGGACNFPGTKYGYCM
jgi:hypothetical protein